MSDWQIMRWDESSFDISTVPIYVQQAYKARKFAFVSDYVRLLVLEQYGGVYVDMDVKVLKSYEPLLHDTAFIGLEESKRHLPGTCVMGCEAHCKWVKDMLALYDNIEFVKPDGSLDMTTNVDRIGRFLQTKGFVPCRDAQYIDEYGLRIYTHDYFSPITSTRVMRKTKNTYSIHYFAESWRDGKKKCGWRDWMITHEFVNALVQIKRIIEVKKTEKPILDSQLSSSREEVPVIHIPHIIHYCWFGSNPLPDLEKKCLASWHEYMPDWEYRWWNEETFDISSAPLYVQQAYKARKYAFVSDYVRLWALEKYGGLYMDVDFMVYRPFDELMDKYAAFAGYEGSKRNPVMQGVIASEAHGAWVKDMLRTYDTRVFIKEDGSLDMTPNTSYFTDRLEAQGFIPDGVEKDVYVNDTFFLHVMPVWAFCPVLTTGEDVRTPETYCEHMGESSWANKGGWKFKVLALVSPSMRTKLIKLKRALLG